MVTAAAVVVVAAVKGAFVQRLYLVVIAIFGSSTRKGTVEGGFRVAFRIGLVPFGDLTNFHHQGGLCFGFAALVTSFRFGCSLVFVSDGAVGRCVLLMNGLRDFVGFTRGVVFSTGTGVAGLDTSSLSLKVHSSFTSAFGSA